MLMLMMASVAFTGCVSDDSDDKTDTTDSTNDGTDTTDPVGADTQSTLDVVLDRGSLKCGIKTSQFGMGYLNSEGVYSGLDVEYCRAIAAAIGLNPDADIEYVVASAGDRFQKLEDKEIQKLLVTLRTAIFSQDKKMTAPSVQPARGTTRARTGRARRCSVCAPA